MTCTEFIRNNRGINGGDNLPQDFLTSLYENISKNEIKISTEAANTAEASPILWSELNLQSKSARGKMLQVASHSTSPALDNILLFHFNSVAWGTCVSAHTRMCAIVVLHVMTQLWQYQYLQSGLNGFMTK